MGQVVSSLCVPEMPLRGHFESMSVQVQGGTWAYSVASCNCTWTEGREEIALPACVHAQSCPSLCDPMNCSLPGSSARGVFQARILEWVAISSSRGSSQPRDRTCISCIGKQVLYHQYHLGSMKRLLFSKCGLNT